jgi:hypothetical protein
MNPAMTQSELVQALEARHEEVGAYFSSLPERTFLGETAPKWNPAQHVIHLSKISIRVRQGLQAREQLPNQSRNLPHQSQPGSGKLARESRRIRAN